MKEVRVLFTGVGRRIELIKAFRDAALVLGIHLKVYGADMAGTAPALAYCDYVRRVCAMKDPCYIDQLSAICDKDRIDILIPTIDTDLLVLSQNTEKFGKTKVLISCPEMIALCRDKNKTAGFFQECGCKTPKTYNNFQDYTGPYPCFIKPKDGSSSINAFRVENAQDLQGYAKQIEDYIIQPFIEGTEYTVDVFCDFAGKPIFIIPRIRLQVRAGEVLKTQICLDAKIIEESRRIISRFKPVGPMTIQLIRQKETGDDYFIEINPRYGGGAPLSMQAGARSAEAILGLLLGTEEYKKNTIDDGAVFSRFDDSVRIHNGYIKQPIKGVIFDLDDTLYQEKQYVRSGFAAVAEYLGDKSIADELWKYFSEGKPAVDVYLEKCGRQEEKAACLEIYREHKPVISLQDGFAQLIEDLKRKAVKVGIITDGRPTGQRNKIEALGLDKIVDDFIITDELGGAQFRKPCDIAFRIMQRRWQIPYEQMMYIGDNATKDFQAPKQLGMRSLYFKNKEGLYFAEGSQEEIEVESVAEISELLNRMM